MSAKSQKKISVSNASSKKKWLPIIILVITTFLYYGNTLKNGYSLDDDLVTSTDNSHHERVEKGIGGIPGIFSSHYVQTAKQQYEYRPVVTSSFAVEYQFFGTKPTKKRASISHLISVLLYAFLIVLIYLLMLKLFPEKTWAFSFLVALLFLIHPIHSEVVNNIKCRDELFVMIFGILGIFSFLKYVDSDYKKITALIIGILMIVLSILSKKVGITFIVLIPLVLYYFREIKIKKFLILFSFMLIGFVVFFLLKKTALSNGVVREKMFFENPLYFSESLIERVPMFFYSIMFYLKMMVVPAPLVYYYGYDQIEIVGWDNPFVWVGVLFVVSGVFFSIKRLKNKEMWSFGFLFFMFGIGGAANLLFPAVGIVAERFVFTASFGLIFITVYYGFQIYEKNKLGKSKLVFYSVFGLLLVLSFSQVNSRNKDWYSRFSLYKGDIKNLPNSAKAHSLLATEYIAIADSVAQKGNISYDNYMLYVDSTIAEFETCLKIYDGYYSAANNAGALYFTRKKNYYKAKPLFRRALSYKPDYVEALFNYGNCLEYDLKGVKELQLIVARNSTDSIVKPNPQNKERYFSERRASYAVYVIKKDVHEILRTINLNATNSRENAIYKIMLAINTNLAVENGLLKSKINVSALKQRVTDGVNSVNSSNAQTQLQSIMSYIENVFYQAIDQVIQLQSKRDITYFNQMGFVLEQLKESLIDSAELYWQKSLEIDPTYYYSYKALTALYLNEERYGKVQEINEKALDEGKFNDNMEFYLNIGNVYNYQKKFIESLMYMEKAIAEVDKSYAKVFIDEAMQQNERQETLMELLNRKKQIIGFIIRIANDAGDFQKASQYQGILNQM